MARQNQIQTVNPQLYRGLYYRKSDTRRISTGAKKFDRYYSYRFKVAGKTYNGVVGWHSEGYVPAYFYPDLVIVRDNIKSGTGPQSYAELIDSRKQQQASIPTLSNFWKTYLTNAKATKKESSWSKEQQHFTDYIEPVAGHLLIDKVDELHIEQVLATLNKLSDRTRRYVIGSLTRILKFAHTRKLRGPAPSTSHLFPKRASDNSRQRLINSEEKDFILAELKSRSLPAYRITLFAFLTGCRFSEAANLRWIDISKDSIRFMYTKNKDHRTIAITTGTRELLDSIPRKGKFVFLADGGCQWKESPSAFRTVCSPLNTGRDELDKIVFHSIRHYVATQLARHLTVKELMSVMGWKSIQMAVRYMKPDQDRQRNALEVLSSKNQQAKVVSLQTNRN